MMGLMSSQDADLFSDDEVPSRRPVLASPSVQALPTPAKEDPDPDDYPRVVRPSLVQLSAEVSPSLPLTTKESDTDARRLPSATQTAHIEGPCPNLWCGRRLNKSVVLLPNTWITLGKEGCHVKLPSRMVSTKHCQLRWVSAARQVEFVDTSTNGTWVSGEKVYRNRKEPKLLEHGARVVIENDPPENRFNFVLDLRPTGLAFADPRQLPRGVDRPKQELEREKWKKHLFSLRMRQDKQESDILEKEKFYHELQVQRRELEAKTQLWQGEIERLKEDTEMVLKKMFEKRDAWKAKLQELYKANEEVTVPLTQRTIEKQDQVHQLEGKSLGEKAELQAEIKRLDEECERKRAELEDHASRYAELNHVLPAGDEVLTLDVAGETFRAYRSTLQQVEGSVLCTLASGRWQGSSPSEGTIFLDCNPHSFKEILEFLRERRLDRAALPSFSPKAARLADYLGIPVARVVEDIYLIAEFQRAGDNKVAPGFMFDVMISGPFECLIHTISFSMGRGGKASLFVRSGSCLEAQTDREGWKELCSLQVVMGRNRMDLPRGEAKTIGPNGVLGVYLCFSEGADDLLYSDKPSQASHKVLSEHRTLSDGMKLVSLKGRVAGTNSFSFGAHRDDRFFVGSIEYSLE
ncbi:unnamed protein product [Durusdinium trenchii]|uniref:FHA domain-containing protein n=1 Tax=Durusdinium trenchii TaxID=1381693 RepID=A0ABP0H9D3_9DINO